MNFFDHHSIFFTWLDYPMSYLEFFGTLAGAIAVLLSARASVWSWPIGIINVTLFFFLFFQVQLYPDMFLQVFFFVTNLIGWWRWTNPKKIEEDGKKQLRISTMPVSSWIVVSLIIGVGTFLFGGLAKNLHTTLPSIFSQPSAFPYADSCVTVMSIVATYLMIQKKIECWIVWMVIDIVAAFLYFSKGIKLVGIESSVFCVMVAFGFWHWRKEYLSYKMPA